MNTHEIYIYTHILQGGHQVAKKSTTRNFPDVLVSSITMFQSSTELILRTREPLNKRKYGYYTYSLHKLVCIRKYLYKYLYFYLHMRECIHTYIYTYMHIYACIYT
jgi:hypothetical protein